MNCATCYTQRLQQVDNPFAIRYPRGNVHTPLTGRDPEVLKIGSWEALADGEDLVFLAVGTMVDHACQARKKTPERRHFCRSDQLSICQTHGPGNA